MFGFVARAIARGTVRFYYRKIEVTGRDKIPVTGPVLFVANHANSLMDPVVIGIAARRPVHFLAKAPLFKIPFFGRILSALGMLPAFRGSDDPSEVGGNVKTFGEAASYLQSGKTVGIFPEGKSHDALKVDKVRSGAARIALQALAQGVTDLKIVPVGINYERKEKFRSSVWVRIGEPIALSDWLERIKEAERVAMRALTAEVDQRLKEVVIHLNEERWEPFIGDLEALIPATGENKRNAIAALVQRKRIADAVNHFIELDRPRAESIAQEIKDHRQRLTDAGLNIRSDVFRLRYIRLFLRQTWDMLLLDIGLVPALLGSVYNFVPFTLVRVIGMVLPRPNRSTISLERLGLGLPIYGLWHGWLWLWLANYFVPWVATVWTLLMLVSGAFALNFWPRARTMFHLWLSESRMVLKKKELSALRRTHLELQKKLGTLADEYRQYRPVTAPVKTIPLWWWVGRQVAFWAICIVLGAAAVEWTGQWIQHSHVSILRPGGLDFARVSEPEVRAMLQEDEKSLIEIMVGLRELERSALAVQAQLNEGKRNFYTQQDNDAIRRLLFSFFSYRTELLRMVWKYQNYASVPEEKLRAQTLTLGLAAASSLVESSFKLVTQFAQTPEAIRKLNEAEPLWDIPEGAYDMIRANLANTGNRQLWAKALRYYEEEGSSIQTNSTTVLFDQTIQRAAKLQPALEELAKNWTLHASVGELQKAGKGVFYRGQSLISTWVGDTRVRSPRDGKALIQPGQLKALHGLLKPGDILIERQNWYLSRAFMPG